MPYRCRQRNGKWFLQVQRKNGHWEDLNDHKTYKSCKAQMRAIGAKTHSPYNKKEIRIEGFIGIWDSSYESISAQIDEANSSEILNIVISSDGGSYFTAMKIYDKLRQHKGKKRIYISPMASSAAAVIALDPNATVYIPENGLIFHHSPNYSNNSNSDKNAEELKKLSEDLDKIESTLVSMIVNRCNKNEEDVKKMLNEGTWFTAKEAKEYGLVDEITPLTRRKTNISNLVLPENVLAHIKSLNGRSEIMALRDVCSSLDLEVKDDMTDDQLDELILNHVNSLSTSIEELKEKIKEPEKKTDPPKFGDGIRKILVQNRVLEIDSLASEGKITPAVAEKLKVKYATEDKIVNYVNEDGDSIDGFDGIIEALKLNEKVINFGGKTTTVIPPGGTDGEHDGLVKRMKARASKK